MPTTRRLLKRKAADNVKDTFADYVPSKSEARQTADPDAPPGRQLRKAAARKSTRPSYIDPDDAISDEDEDVFVEDYEDNIRVAKKRKRSPTPPMTPRRMIDDSDPLDEVVHSHETDLLHTPTVPPLSLTFNVPVGHSGPFVVNLDVNSLINASHSMLASSSLRTQPHTPFSVDSGYASKSRGASEQTTSGELVTQSSPLRPDVAGFLSLPPELRNQIYRLLFISTDKLDFGHPRNFSRSSHFLRSCKQVHEEARSILYAENTFYFQTARETRTRRFETGAYQIGYKDIRYFLSCIGTANLGLMRHIIMVFEDLVPSLNPRLKSIDERRFTNNDDLYAIMRLLGDHGRLQTIKLSFQGRRWFFEHDEPRFASYLVRISADKVDFIDWPDHFYNAGSKSPKLTETELAKEMKRATPMYSPAETKV